MCLLQVHLQTVSTENEKCFGCPWDLNGLRKLIWWRYRSASSSTRNIKWPLSVSSTDLITHMTSCTAPVAAAWQKCLWCCKSRCAGSLAWTMHTAGTGTIKGDVLWGRAKLHKGKTNITEGVWCHTYVHKLTRTHQWRNLGLQMGWPCTNNERHWRINKCMLFYMGTLDKSHNICKLVGQHGQVVSTAFVKTANTTRDNLHAGYNRAMSVMSCHALIRASQIWELPNLFQIQTES